MRKFDKPKKTIKSLLKNGSGGVWKYRIGNVQNAIWNLSAIIVCLPILSRFKKLVSILLNRIHRLTIFSCCMYLTEN